MKTPQGGGAIPQLSLWTSSKLLLDLFSTFVHILHSKALKTKRNSHGPSLHFHFLHFWFFVKLCGALRQHIELSTVKQ
ncbi:hypothetical protein, partial [Marinimicrobium locisalis]|uniref:hypothetical protein n=1 Tax=Marinimicrobium locisalis TaxID=546022 RepID=UPI0032221C6B